MLGCINSEVVISDTLADEGKDDVNATHKKAVTEYLAEQKHKYGSLETREKQIIQDYKKNPEGCELIIVVDKLLTGFDAPRDTALYLAKQLKTITYYKQLQELIVYLMVMQVSKSKTAGLIVDYSKNAKTLKML